MDKFKFGSVQKKLEEVKKSLPQKLAIATQKYFDSSFDKQGWDGNHWQEVKRRIAGTPGYKYPLNKHLARRINPININTGALRKSIKILQAKFDSIVIIADAPYAGYINDGTRKIPQRRFMGDSEELQKQQIKIITNEFKKIWPAL